MHLEIHLKFAAPAFYIAGAEILPVHLQGFGDILRILQLDEGLSCRLSIFVIRKMDSVHTFGNATLCRNKKGCSYGSLKNSFHLKVNSNFHNNKQWTLKWFTLSSLQTTCDGE